ncbi:hypothetical protein C8A05DRAFT_48333 [Staphylotrichum tortipilum]|uniref:HNH nuclease domain-containing protein n=1 Tax=Staphylotrichum tortipilum TaxID=2831512 RepID=A0AAN6M8P6_9PEZI|nr:hypothetical protein C8A05DRAFT_48333 [Staphylotrichum longicolle]
MDPDFAHFQRAVAADRETVLRVLRDIPPTAEPVLDYITEVDVRCALFSELQQLHRLRNVPSMPNAATLAFFMVAPIEKIRNHLTDIRNVPPQYMVHMLGHINLEAPAALSAYIPTNRSSIGQQSIPMSPPTMILGNPGDVARSKTAAISAKQRDRNTCLLSGTIDPEAAHIFPFATSKNKQFGSLGALLQSFWGDEQASTWRQLCEDPAITQSLANYLSLDRQIHFWFDKARFALKPLSQTQTTITVQFHWLRRTSLSPMDIIKETDGEELLEVAGLRTPTETPATWGSCLAHRASGVPIRTGQTFLIRANHPTELPNFQLLELQWNLLRVAAICGAADVTDEDDFDVDDYEGPYLVTSEETTARQSEASMHWCCAGFALAPDGHLAGPPIDQPAFRYLFHLTTLIALSTRQHSVPNNVAAVGRANVCC